MKEEEIDEATSYREVVWKIREHFNINEQNSCIEIIEECIYSVHMMPNEGMAKP